MESHIYSVLSSKEIGKSIQKRRRALKITQKELAERLGKSERTIQKYESGEITMKIDAIKEIAEELDISWQDLLSPDRPLNGTPMITDNPKDASPDYEFHTMGDVIKALFAITNIKDFSFQLTNTKPPENPEWTAGIMVNGKGDSQYDADFCLFMENWMQKLNALRAGRISQEQFEAWKIEMIDYYSESYFSDLASILSKHTKQDNVANVYTMNSISASPDIVPGSNDDSNSNNSSEN